MGVIEFQDVYEHTKNLSLLYVEDDELLRRSSSELFDKFFETVIVSSDGQEAMEAYKGYHTEYGRYIDIVITDILMPNINGMELIGKIRKLNPNQIIIVLSAYNDSNRLMNLIELGIDSFMVKPIEYQPMLDLLYKYGRQIEDQKIAHQYNEKLEEVNLELTDAYMLVSKEKEQLEEQLEELKRQT